MRGEEEEGGGEERQGERGRGGARGGEGEERRWKGGCGLRGAVVKRCGAWEVANHRREPRARVKREERGSTLATDCEGEVKEQEEEPAAGEGRERVKRSR